MAFTMCNQRQRLALELNVIPAGFPATLERRGLARQVEVTAAGIALEPVGPLAEILAACRSAGLRVRCDGRRAPDCRSWVHAARPAATVCRRLSDELSPVWLPTHPAA